MNDAERLRQQAALARLERFSRLTDASIGLPGTRFRFGLDALIGLIPGIGDLAGLVLSGYVLLEAQRAGASRRVKGRMLLTMLVDFLAGLVPVAGDLFDAFYKANTRNTRLLKRHLRERLEIDPKPPFPWRRVATATALVAGVVVLTAILV